MSIDPPISESRMQRTAKEPVVDLSHVRFTWQPASLPVITVDSLRVFQGERLLLRGPSGCGKSTLLSILAGVLKAQDGSTVEQSREDSAILQLGRTCTIPGTVAGDVLGDVRFGRHLRIAH
jgi:ABC-type transport system involved in cytochrome bd biosynthesis fused ATPase/permease subunit